MNKLTAWSKGLELSPIAVKELRGRMRGARAFAVISIYLLIVSGLSILVYASAQPRYSYSGDSNSQVGITMFYVLMSAIGLLVCIFAPAFMTGAITGERERQTFEILRTTLLTPGQIAWGKLSSGLSFVFLLTFASAPLISLTFLLGGVESAHVIMFMSVMLATAILISTIGLYVSSRAASTLTATVITYGIVFFVLIGLPVIAGLVLAIIDSSIRLSPSGIPDNILSSIAYLLASLHPISSIAVSLTSFSDDGNLWTMGQHTLKPFPLANIAPMPFVLTTLFYLLLSAMFVGLSIDRIRHADNS